MNTHDLKCHPHFFAAIAAGKKTFEIRRNDRDYRIGDMLNLREYDPTFGNTGRVLNGLEVVYIMLAEDFPAILPGFVIMGLCGVPSMGMEDSREDNAKAIGVVIANLPLTRELEQCNAYREVAGLPYSKATPCAKCVEGICIYPKGKPDG